MRFKQHKNLAKKIWLSDDLLNPDVSLAVIQIIRSLFEFFHTKYNINIQEFEIRDIFVYGSIANYCYTKKSDIDVCIVLDFTRLRTQSPFINMQSFFRLAYKEWSKSTRPTIFNHQIDISFDDVFFAQRGGRHRAGPMYSLTTNSWIYRPIRLDNDEFDMICKQSDKVYKQIIHEYRQIKRNGGFWYDFEQLHRKITSEKNNAYDNQPDQPITPIYLAWRRLRYNGIIDKILREIRKQKSASLSLK